MYFIIVSKEIFWNILFILIINQVSYVKNQCTQFVCNTTTKFRTIDGRCNNLQHPSWGMVNTPHVRLKPPRYSDDHGASPRSITGDPLPSPRLLTSTLYGENNITDNALPCLYMQWGQFITHDLVLTPVKGGVLCCSASGEYTSIFSDACMSISIPKLDKVFQNRSCMNFFRSQTYRETCNVSDSTPQFHQQVNSVTHFLDLSQLYSSFLNHHNQLRDFLGGRLATSNINNFEFPPTGRSNCVMDSTNDLCFLVGDNRGNQNYGLLTLHTLLLRHHNYLADQLSEVNPEWGDERRFQEARRLNIAIYQHITYNEYLPTLIGEQIVAEILNQTYDKNVNPSIINEFTAATFRYLHTQINGRLDFFNGKRRLEESILLSDTLFKPRLLTLKGRMEKLLRGMTMQAMNFVDISYDTEVSRYMLKFNNELGLDLRSIDIQRGRDHGLPSYNDMREYCGLKRGKAFEDFVEIENKSIELLKTLYSSPDDVDFYVGGSLEMLLKGIQFGPTFHCIVIKQFLNIKVGDRFFYTSDDPNIRFTPKQMHEIRSKSSLAALICRSSHIMRVQKYALKRNINPNVNPLLFCDSISEIDFSLWASR